MNLMEVLCVLLVVVMLGTVVVPMTGRYWEKQDELLSLQYQLVTARSFQIDQYEGGKGYDSEK